MSDAPQVDEGIMEAPVRADYAKFKCELDVDNFGAFDREFRECMETGKALHNWTGNYKSGIARMVDKQRRVFYWEVWGELSQSITYLPWDGWEGLLERVDVRQEVNWSDGGKDALYQHLKRSGTGGRMLQEFNKPKRQKVGGRDGGGSGFAVGSHKSDFRWSVYRRGGEAGAIEFQLGGGRIARAQTQIRQLMDDAPASLVGGPWVSLMRTLHHSAWYETRVITGLGKGDIRGIVAGDVLPPMDYNQHKEHILAQLRELPSDMRNMVVMQAQLELFA